MRYRTRVSYLIASGMGAALLVACGQTPDDTLGGQDFAAERDEDDARPGKGDGKGGKGDRKGGKGDGKGERCDGDGPGGGIVADECVSTCTMKYQPLVAGCLSSSKDPRDLGRCGDEAMQDRIAECLASCGGGACADAKGAGQYEFAMCGPDGSGGGGGKTAEIGCLGALANCLVNDWANPKSGIKCAWNGRVIYANGCGGDVPPPPPPGDECKVCQIEARKRLGACVERYGDDPATVRKCEEIYKQESAACAERCMQPPPPPPPADECTECQIAARERFAACVERYGKEPATVQKCEAVFKEESAACAKRCVEPPPPPTPEPGCWETCEAKATPDLKLCLEKAGSEPELVNRCHIHFKETVAACAKSCAEPPAPPPVDDQVCASKCDEALVPALKICYQLAPDDAARGLCDFKYGFARATCVAICEGKEPPSLPPPAKP